MSVVGPIEPRVKQEESETAVFTVKYVSISGGFTGSCIDCLLSLSGRKEKVYASFLTECFRPLIITHRHPRSTILVTVHELHDDGGVCMCYTFVMTIGARGGSEWSDDGTHDSGYTIIIDMCMCCYICKGISADIVSYTR